MAVILLYKTWNLDDSDGFTAQEPSQQKVEDDFKTWFEGQPLQGCDDILGALDGGDFDCLARHFLTEERQLAVNTFDYASAGSGLERGPLTELRSSAALATYTLGNSATRTTTNRPYFASTGPRLSDCHARMNGSPRALVCLHPWNDEMKSHAPKIAEHDEGRGHQARTGFAGGAKPFDAPGVFDHEADALEDADDGAPAVADLVELEADENKDVDPELDRRFRWLETPLAGNSGPDTDEQQVAVLGEDRRMTDVHFVVLNTGLNYVHRTEPGSSVILVAHTLDDIATRKRNVPKAWSRPPRPFFSNHQTILIPANIPTNPRPTPTLLTASLRAAPLLTPVVAPALALPLLLVPVLDAEGFAPPAKPFEAPVLVDVGAGGLVGASDVEAEAPEDTDDVEPDALDAVELEADEDDEEPEPELDVVSGCCALTVMCDIELAADVGPGVGMPVRPSDAGKESVSAVAPQSATILRRT
ncbi:hypothetical protein EIP86_000195 [Pleurotus ostreatoroseus]|nr:hypothetical protein EIP86_000195 [Pleurotus ostreatoroseus]